MTRDDVYSKLTVVFENVFGEEIELNDEVTADDVKEWDSVNHIRLVLSVQKAFDVKFGAAEIDRLECVGDLVSLILAKSPKS